MKLEINVPDSLNEITLGQYQKFLRIEQTDEQFVAQKMLEIFCGVKLTEAMSMRIKDVRAIISHLDELLSQQPQLVKKFSLKGQEYGFIPNLEDMSFPVTIYKLLYCIALRICLLWVCIAPTSLCAYSSSLLKKYLGLCTLRNSYLQG